MHYIVDQLQKLAKDLLFSWFYPSKRKIRKDDFNRFIIGSGCIGALEVCDYLSYIHQEDPLKTVDEMMGEIHKIRYHVWEEYAKHTVSVKRLNDVTDAMVLEANIDKFVTDPFLRNSIKANSAAAACAQVKQVKNDLKEQEQYEQE